MKQYLDLVKHVLETGTRKENRTGVDTISTFNHNYEIDLRDGFPLLTTKAVSWKNIVVEMLWFLSGQTDISILKRHGCKFWDAWADPETGKVPSAYGNFWRQFPVHVPEKFADYPSSVAIGFNDQIAWVLAEMKRNPMSRRMVVSAWAPGNAQTSKLPPCHCLFMFNVQNMLSKNDEAILLKRGGMATPSTTEELNSQLETDFSGKRDLHDQIVHAAGGGHGPLMGSNPPRSASEAPREIAIEETVLVKRLCLHLTQRSCDVALGVPYNIASYALLLHLFSRFSGIEAGIFAHSLVDAHIYTSKPLGEMHEYDHVPGLRVQLQREPRPLPRLHIDGSIQGIGDIENLMAPSVTTEEIMSKFVLEGYEPYEAIPFKVAV